MIATPKNWELMTRLSHLSGNKTAATSHYVQLAKNCGECSNKGGSRRDRGVAPPSL
jgi:hypothetical protein